MSLFTLIKFLHILFAIVAVGFNASYAIWLTRAGQDPTQLRFALRGIKFLDDRFANPCYGLLLLSGLLMVWVGGFSLRTFWIAAAIVLWVVTVVLAATLYTPALRTQIQVLEASGVDSEEYKQASNRQTVSGIVVVVPVLVILILMVFKPTF
jgi:uncharacterized membrane protein